MIMNMVFAMAVFMMLFIMAMFCPIFMLMRMFMTFFLFQNHIKITGIDPAFLRPSDRYFIPVQRQSLQRLPEDLLSGSQIQERAHGHISADAGVTFQI